MAYRQNIYARPFVVRLRRKGQEFDAVFWAASKEELRERMEIELSDKIELVSIRERDK